MIWQRPAAAKKIPNATVPQPKFVNLKLLNCYNNAAIKNHLPLIYIYIWHIIIWYQYFLDTSTTTSNSSPSISALVMRSWSRVQWSKSRKGSLQQVRCPSERSAASMRVEYLIAVESIQPTWWWPTHFFGEILPCSSEMIKIYVSKTTWSTTSIFGSVSSFLTGHWPHLLMFLNVLDGFFHKFEPGLGLSPALKDVENRLNVNRGFPERPVTPQHSNTPNLSKG